MQQVPDKVKRSDGHGLRQEQIELTERRIVDAAQRLFVERGYAATTLSEVADAAGVAPRTVYVRFGTKARLLDRCMGASIVGDLERTPLLEREESRAHLEAPTLDGRIRGFVELGERIMERSGALRVVAAQAAAMEPEIAELEHRGMQRALADFTSFVRRLDADGMLPPGMTVALAIDVVWACAGPRSQVSAISDRGWTAEQFATWLDTTLRWFFRLE